MYFVISASELISGSDEGIGAMHPSIVVEGDIRANDYLSMILIEWSGPQVKDSFSWVKVYFSLFFIVFLELTHVNTFSYYPQSNGKVERFQCTI